MRKKEEGIGREGGERGPENGGRQGRRAGGVRRRGKGRTKEMRSREGRRTQEETDYGRYRLRVGERVKYAAEYAFLDGAISCLFFDSAAVFLTLLPGMGMFWRSRQHRLSGRRREELRGQFLTGMQMVCTALRAGCSMENAFRQVAGELTETYGSDAPIVREFQLIVTKLGLNLALEGLLLDLGERSKVEDIRSFAEVLSTARRTGGDLLAIIANTIAGIERREETQKEICTQLAGRRMELNMMSCAPLAILGYIRLTSPEFLTPMYGSQLGAAVMAGCLAVYGAAFFWGHRLLDIEV